MSRCVAIQLQSLVSLVLITALISLLPLNDHLNHMISRDSPAVVAVAAPIQVPDLSRCEPAQDRSVVGPATSLIFNCCLPVVKKSDMVDFSFEKYPSKQKRVRRPAHKVDAKYVAKYNLAYQKMRALPPHDPRSLALQANVHCAFCNGAFHQGGAGGNTTLQVHFSWLFLPWHRWFLYFHERILGNLVGDTGFSLVYWNWDDQSGDGGNIMPEMFARKGTALYDEKREPAHARPYLARLSATSNASDSAVVVNENLNVMYQSVVTASSAELFTGGAYRLGTDVTNSSVLSAPLGGSLENGPHNAIHFWTGSSKLPLFQDMGTLSTASRDPIFYAHHSNLDRVWDVWQNYLPTGKRADHTDPDFLNAEFVFYDEKARMVKVKAKDALDLNKMGVVYRRAKADSLWINYSPPPLTHSSATNAARSNGVPVIEASPTNGTIKLGSNLVGIVKRQAGPKPSANLNEVLVVEGVSVTRNNFTELVVFVNLPDANAATTTSSAEYVGTYNLLPEIGQHKHVHANLKLEIGDNIKRIGLQKESAVVITIVKKGGTDAVTIQGMKITYQ